MTKRGAAQKRDAGIEELCPPKGQIEVLLEMSEEADLTPEQEERLASRREKATNGGGSARL